MLLSSATADHMMLELPLLDYKINTKVIDRKVRVFDPIRKKWLILTPEEHVRQLLLFHLTEVLQYPASLIAVEKGLWVGTRQKRFDIVVYNRGTHLPWMLVECKSPEIALSDVTLQQLLDYHNQLQCQYWMITNGHQHFCADARDINKISWITELPAYQL